MTDFGKWIKTSFGGIHPRVIAGIIMVVVPGIFTAGVGVNELMDDASAVTARLDTVAAIQVQVVGRLDRLEPRLKLVDFLYCVAKEEAAGREVGPFTCDETGRD